MIALNEIEMELDYLLRVRADYSVLCSHLADYQYHLKQYDILSRPLPPNNYDLYKRLIDEREFYED